jgi:hypothetical protein
MQRQQKYSKDIRMLSKPFILVLLICAPLAFGQSEKRSSPDACAAVHSAYREMFSASNHNQTTNSGAANVTQAYATITGEAGYKESCKYLRDETLAGESAAVYSDIFTAKSGTATGTVWISKKAGYTLRQDVDVDMGAKGKGHQSITFDYPKK